MGKKSRPVAIISVDTNTVEKDSTFREAYAFYIKLSEEPDPVWEKYLLKWQNALHCMRRDMKVVGDRLRLVCVYSDDIQSFVEYARHLVQWINERVEEHNKQVEQLERKQLKSQEIDQKREDEIRRRLKEL